MSSPNKIANALPTKKKVTKQTRISTKTVTVCTGIVTQCNATAVETTTEMTTTTNTTMTEMTTTTKAITSCKKWLYIPDEFISEYDAEVVRICPMCKRENRDSYKRPYVIHKPTFGDYTCFQCGEDVDLAYVCMTCRQLNQKKH